VVSEKNMLRGQLDRKCRKPDYGTHEAHEAEDEDDVSLPRRRRLVEMLSCGISNGGLGARSSVDSHSAGGCGRVCAAIS